MRRDPCAVHPWHARRNCRACLADHKAGEHRGRHDPHCPACRIQVRLAEARANTKDARSRAANDR